MKRRLVSETDPAVPALRRRLDDFYAAETHYDAFQVRSWHPQLWSFVVNEIAQMGKADSQILELGAGRTGFRQYLRERRIAAHFMAQDVTPSNENYLRENADEVVIGPLENVHGNFDIIFSTFVMEHMTDPQRSLEICWNLLKPGGTLFIFCPRYDAPFYLSHSADHYSGLTRFGLALGLMTTRLATLLTRQPRFLIHVDPAVLHLPWERDRDAVHWVSLFDLSLFFKYRGCLRKLSIPSGNLKDAIVKNLLQVNIAVEKPKAGSTEPGQNRL